MSRSIISWFTSCSVDTSISSSPLTTLDSQPLVLGSSSRMKDTKHDIEKAALSDGIIFIPNRAEVIVSVSTKSWASGSAQTSSPIQPTA
ncbi:hypothetical protein VCR12J2_1450002 [Vibrio coralliirubri]|nr:hypothetical protein VCR12J2_1450002 [Vibrio coralliirubri]